MSETELLLVAAAAVIWYGPAALAVRWYPPGGPLQPVAPGHALAVNGIVWAASPLLALAAGVAGAVYGLAVLAGYLVTPGTE